MKFIFNIVMFLILIKNYGCGDNTSINLDSKNNICKNESTCDMIEYDELFNAHRLISDALKLTRKGDY